MDVRCKALRNLQYLVVHGPGILADTRAWVGVSVLGGNFMIVYWQVRRKLGWASSMLTSQVEARAKLELKVR